MDERLEYVTRGQARLTRKTVEEERKQKEIINEREWWERLSERR